MTRKKGLISAAITFAQVFVFALIISLSHSQARAGATGFIDVTGTVTNASGTGIGDVSVYATDPGTSNVDFGPITTNASGYYDLPVSAGTYDFHYDAPSGDGFSSVVDSDVPILSDQTINIQLTPAYYTLSGYLTDQNGNPLGGLSISLTNSSGQSASATTNPATGYFSFSAQAGVYTSLSIGVNGSPFYPTNRDYFDVTSPVDIDLTSGPVTQNVQLSMAQLTVDVNDANGNPLSNVNVGINGQGGTIPPIIPGSSTTGTFGGGETSFGGTTTNGSYSVMVPEGLSLPNGGTGNQNGNICVTINNSPVCMATPLTVNGNTTVTITAPAYHTLSGYLTDQNGNPLGGLSISITSASGQSASATTNPATGYFSFSAQAGVYTNLSISVNGNPFYPTNQDFFGVNSPVSLDLSGGDVAQNLQLSMAQLTVDVNDANGNPLSSISVVASGGGGTIPPIVPGSTTTGNFGGGETSFGGTTTNGSYSVMVPEDLSLPNGGSDNRNGNICATINNSPVCMATPLTVNGNTTVTINAPAYYTLSGYLTDQNGNPLGGLSISLTNSSGQSASATTNPATGYFSFSAQAGVYTSLSIGVNGSPFYPTNRDYFDVTSPVDIDLTSGPVTQNVQLSMAQLTVDVNDANGNPLSNVNVGINGQGGTIPPIIPGSSTTGTFGGGETSFGGTTTNGSYSVMVPEGLSLPNGGTGNQNGNICVTINNSPVCMATPLTVNGNTTVIFQQGQSTVVTPSAPTNLSASSPTQTPLLTWTGSGGATSYNVYRNGVNIGSSNTSSYSDNAAFPSTYNYYVTAVNAAGESGQSNVISVTVTSPAPTNLSAPTPTNQPPALSWIGVSGAAYYNIYRNGTDVGSSNTTSFTDTNAPTGTNSYYVTAVSEAGLESSPSNTISVVYDITPPTVTLSGVVSGETYPANETPAPVCTTTDSLSGVATNATVTITNSGLTYTATCSGATDNAGNTAAPVSVSYTLLPANYTFVNFTDSNGNNLNNAKVTIENSASQVTTLSTDSFGNTYLNTTPGTYKVTIYYANGYESENITVTANGPNNISFSTIPVTVTINDPSSSDIANASVAQAGNTGDFGSKVSVNSNGQVTFQVLPGSSTFTAYDANGYEQQSIVVSNTLNTVTFNTYAVTVTVTKNGTPLTTATVIQAGDSGDYGAHEAVNGSGQITYNVLPGTNYFVAYDGSSYTKETLTVTGNTSTTISVN